MTPAGMTEWITVIAGAITAIGGAAIVLYSKLVAIHKELNGGPEKSVRQLLDGIGVAVKDLTRAHARTEMRLDTLEHWACEHPRTCRFNLEEEGPAE